MHTSPPANRQRRMQGFEQGNETAADGAGRCCCSCCGCWCWLWHWRVFLVQVMYQHICEHEAGISCSNYGDCCGSSGSSCSARCYHCFVICRWRILIIWVCMHMHTVHTVNDLCTRRRRWYCTSTYQCRDNSSQLKRRRVKCTVNCCQLLVFSPAVLIARLCHFYT